MYPTFPLCLCANLTLPWTHGNTVIIWSTFHNIRQLCVVMYLFCSTYWNVCWVNKMCSCDRPTGMCTTPGIKSIAAGNEYFIVDLYYEGKKLASRPYKKGVTCKICPQSSVSWIHYSHTELYRYNESNFLENLHKRFPIYAQWDIERCYNSTRYPSEPNLKCNFVNFSDSFVNGPIVWELINEAWAR